VPGCKRSLLCPAVDQPHQHQQQEAHADLGLATLLTVMPRYAELQRASSQRQLQWQQA
jgi:hypothetical protein